MSAIDDDPLVYDFGLEFDYSLWTMDSELTFCVVPWDAEYRDVWLPDSKAQLDAYIDNQASHTMKLSALSYVKPGHPIEVGLRHNIANQFNYVRVRNKLQPGGGDKVRDYYYFINATDYVNPGNTAIYVQLDVWSTYIYDCEFGNAYVERGHIGIANANNFDSFGRKYLTVPEGMDVGSEYMTVTNRRKQVMGVFYDEATNTTSMQMSIIVVATQDLASSPYKADGITPNMVTATGTTFGGVYTGAGMYGFKDFNSFFTWLDANKDASWRTQSIQAAYYVPAISRYSSYDYFDGVSAGTPVKLNAYSPIPVKHRFLANWRDSPELLEYLGPRYRHLLKFFTSPYMILELTSWTANPLIIKPEAWGDPDGYVMERASMMPPSQRVEFIPRLYNSIPGTNIENWQNRPDNDPIIVENPRLADIGDDGGEYLDFAARITNFPSVPIVSSAGLAYLAQNYASIAASYKGADWSQQRAMAAAQTGFDQSMYGSGANNERWDTERQLQQRMTGVGNQNIVNQQNIGTGQHIASGLIMQGSDGFNPLSLLGNGVQAAADNARAIVNIQANNDSLAAQLAAGNQNNQISRQQDVFNRDTNLALASFAAKGDYAQAILGLDAKVQDAHMLQPAMSGQYGGEFANISNESFDISLRWKMIDPAAIVQVGEFWLQFGYAVHRSVATLPPKLRVMTKFSYWKLSKTYLRAGAMPEPHRQAIRGILEKGVTVWVNATDIGFTDFGDNAPLGGITL